MECKAYWGYRLIDLKLWLSPAIDHQQILFFFDSFDAPVGYITWANLAPDSADRLLKDPNFLLHESEWDEGNLTWIIDCCFPYGNIKYAIPEIRRVLSGQGIEKVSWARRDADYSVRKIFEAII